MLFQNLRHCCGFSCLSHKSVNLVTGNPMNVIVKSISESVTFSIHAGVFFLDVCSAHTTLCFISAVWADKMFHDLVNPSKYQMFS